MNDVLADAYNAGELSPTERLAHLQEALTAMHKAMFDLGNRATEIEAQSAVGVYSRAEGASMLKEATAQQRKLTAKVVMLERIIASLDDDSTA